MLTITLPDGSKKEFDAPLSGYDVAMSIGEGLAKAALAMNVNGKDVDITTTITADSTVTFYTARDAIGIDTMRHTLAAQVMARAIKNLYPSAKLAIGPTIEHGFYYDVASEIAISDTDLPKIEAEMKKIISEGLNIKRVEYTRADAIALFESRNEPYKVKIIEDVPETETHFGIYEQGDGVFYDLCRGPHLTSLRQAKKMAYKLTKVSGAYWRGDSKNEMLTRIYAVAFANKDDLKAHLHMMEEALKRDHRKIGPAMNLFHLQEEALGQVFWHDKGWQMFLQLQTYIRGKLAPFKYEEVNTPKIIDHSLYVKSGHWEKFSTGEIFEIPQGDTTFALKPMNCPCHVQIFNQGIKSYRDLPLRMAEFGCCMRNEASGGLNGLLRVRSMTQDDAHIFCTPEQIEQEVVQLCELIKDIYNDFGFKNVRVKFSDRPDMRVGSDAVWDAAEQALKDACETAGLEWTLNPGEGAFYGPKLEFVMKDCIGRDWQCGTIQMDFNMPGRLGAQYVDQNGEKQSPVMIHRALLGSIERFMGILIENFAGHFPLWLAPEQMVVMGISGKQDDAVKALSERLIAEGFRSTTDLRNEKVSYKIREHNLAKTPVQLVLGDREVENGTVTVRRLGSMDQTTMTVEDLISAMHNEISSKALPTTAEKA